MLIRPFVSSLGGDFDTLTLSDFLAIRVEDMEAQLRTLQVDATLISPCIRGRLARHIQALAEVGGMQPPTLGTMLPAAPTLVSGRPALGDTISSERKRKMSTVMEQHDDSEFELIGAEL